MCLHGVLGSAVKRLDASMLFYPLEKKFDPPPCLVQMDDDESGEYEIVCEEDEVFARLGIVIMNTAQWLRVTSGGIDACEDDGLIASQAGGLVHGTGVATFALKAALGAWHKKGTRLMHRIKAGEVEIPPIHDVEGPGFGNQDVEDVHIRHFSV